MELPVFPIHERTNEQISGKLKQKMTFVIDSVSRIHMSETVATIEKLIEAEGLRCRIYQKGRVGAALGASLALSLPGAIIAGAATAVGSAAHHLATFNPDYEVAKNIATGTITLTYQK